MFRARAVVLFSTTMLVALAIGPAPQAAAFVEAKICLAFPVYTNTGIPLDDPECRRWVCLNVVYAGESFVTPACQSVTVYPMTTVNHEVYMRGVLNPQVPLDSFTLRATVRDLSQPNMEFPDCVWTQTNIEAGVQLFLDSCLRDGGPRSEGGPWVFEPSFESTPANPDDPSTVYGALKSYYGARPAACAWQGTVGVYECVKAP